MSARFFAVALLLAACSSPPVSETTQTSQASGDAYEAQYHDSERAIAALQTLSSDAYEGRKTGEPGNLKAQDWIESQLRDLGVSSVYPDGYRAPFTVEAFSQAKDDISGTNLFAEIEGSAGADAPVIIISAHYDHLGIKDDDIYNGADDNASGVAALIEVIDWFNANPPENTLVFAFFDAEEDGITGSAHFVANLPDPMRDRLALNLNLDMVARADKGELYAVGTYHFPELTDLVDTVARKTPLTLKRGHDSPEWGDQDWSLQSDHAPFLRAGYRILYLGVEDHADYHQPTDTFENIDPAAFARSIDTLILVAEAADDWVADLP